MIGSPEPTVVRRDGFHVVGIPLFGNPQEAAFEKAWSLFGEIADETPRLRESGKLYGLQIYPPRYPKPFEFVYLAGVEMAPGTETPLRCVRKDLPAAEYAVFEVEGGPGGIDDAYRRAYEEQLPAAGLERSLPFDFEQYEKPSDPESDPARISVWIPVRKIDERYSQTRPYRLTSGTPSSSSVTRV